MVVVIRWYVILGHAPYSGFVCSQPVCHFLRVQFYLAICQCPKTILNKIKKWHQKACDDTNSRDVQQTSFTWNEVSAASHQWLRERVSPDYILVNTQTRSGIAEPSAVILYLLVLHICFNGSTNIKCVTYYPKLLYIFYFPFLILITSTKKHHMLRNKCYAYINGKIITQSANKGWDSYRVNLKGHSFFTLLCFLEYSVSFYSDSNISFFKFVSFFFHFFFLFFWLSW